MMDEFSLTRFLKTIELPATFRQKAELMDFIAAAEHAAYEKGYEVAVEEHENFDWRDY